MNILYILCDQLRFDVLSCNGARVCQTPHLDILAKSGTNFTRCYSANALCSPARGTILTGMYPHLHGQLANMGNFNGVFDRQIMAHKGYAHYLQQLGMRTGYAGKWHLPAEGDCAFWHFDQWRTTSDYRAYLLARGIDYEMGRDEVAPIEFGSHAVFHGPCSLDAQDHEDAWTTRQICEMMKAFHQENRSFMVCAAFHGPHFPYAVPRPYDTLYDPSTVIRFENFDETFVDKPMVQQMELMRWNTAHLTWKDWQKVIAAYWGYVSFLDSLVGTLLCQLRKLGIEDKTAVIFSTDHGDMLGGHRLFNKGFNMYEEDHHIPLIIRWPGVSKPGMVCDKFCGLVDVFPTLLDMGGARIPSQAQGRSLRALASGTTPPDWRDDILCEFNGYESTLLSMRMVRTEKWKYVYNPFDQDELYDMVSDPGELHNLAALPAFTHVLRRMRERMLKRLHEVNDGIVDVTSWQSNSYRLFVSERER